MRKNLAYLRYFWFLLSNWGPALAFFVIWHDVKGERRLQIDTTGIDKHRDTMGEAQRRHASIYQPINFYTATQLMDTLTASEKNTRFLDVGCGRGRMLALAADYGFTCITGLELSAKLCIEAAEMAQELESRYHPSIEIDIACEDAAHFSLPDDTGVIFMFNPFDSLVMAGFGQQVKESLQRHPRPVKLLYANALYPEPFLKMGFRKTHFFSRLYFLDGTVFEYNP